MAENKLLAGFKKKTTSIGALYKSIYDDRLGGAEKGCRARTWWVGSLDMFFPTKTEVQ